MQYFLLASCSIHEFDAAFITASKQEESTHIDLYKQRADEIVVAVKKRDMDYLIKNTSPFTIQHFQGVDKMIDFYEKTVFNHLKCQYDLIPKNDIQFHYDKYLHTGFGISYKIVSKECQGTLEIIIFNYNNNDDFHKSYQIYSMFIKK